MEENAVDDVGDFEPNDQLVLIAGISGDGKSASLRNIRNQEKWMYLNCEAGKRLPFKNKFQVYKITDPYQVQEAFDYAIANPDEVEGIIIDTVTFLMDMYESVYVLPSTNTMAAWGNYNQYFKEIMQQKVPAFGKPVLVLAHVRDDLDEKSMSIKTAVPIKGALRGQGVEAFFSTVVMAKKVPIKELEKFSSGLLHITEDEAELKYKHVFQTRPTATTTGERVRSPMGLFARNQTFIDNDAQLLLDHLAEFYKS